MSLALQEKVSKSASKALRRKEVNELRKWRIKHLDPAASAFFMLQCGPDDVPEIEWQYLQCSWAAAGFPSEFPTKLVETTPKNWLSLWNPVAPLGLTEWFFSCVNLPWYAPEDFPTAPVTGLTSSQESYLVSDVTDVARWVQEAEMRYTRKWNSI